VLRQIAVIINVSADLPMIACVYDNAMRGGLWLGAYGRRDKTRPPIPARSEQNFCI